MLRDGGPFTGRPPKRTIIVPFDAVEWYNEEEELWSAEKVEIVTQGKLTPSEHRIFEMCTRNHAVVAHISWRISFGCLRQVNVNVLSEKKSP